MGPNQHRVHESPTTTSQLNSHSDNQFLQDPS